MRNPRPVRLLLGLPVLLSLGLVMDTQNRLETTRRDFQQPGTLSGASIHPLQEAASCAGCHGDYDDAVEPYSRWASSMMAQASRDPIYLAALAIAEQDAGEVGDYCWRCHAPNGWVAGRAHPTDGSNLDPTESDLEGVSCAFCHRLVDPVWEETNPRADLSILDAVHQHPGSTPHSGQYILDPEDTRRGPFELGPGFGHHLWAESSYHRESLLCGTCHDVSNPLYVRMPDGSYELSELDTPHPSSEKEDQFPVERTYTEWALSDYALGPMDVGGRFGGNASAVSTCQDCHMPDATGSAAKPGQGEIRDDLPLHDFNGANSWVLRAVHALHPETTTGLDDDLVEAALARNQAMMEAAAELELFMRDGRLMVRVINHTGHKLPTGYGEGRRMWLEVTFQDEAGEVLAVVGAYDHETATLQEDTRIWEIVHGLDARAARRSGLPTGPSFHFVLNNKLILDNRIPPRGYSSRAFHAGGATVLGAAYPDEHFWDEVPFDVPDAAVSARVRLMHQTTTREYIEFLRDGNTTNDAGRTAYEQWLLHGKSAPAAMASDQLRLSNQRPPAPISFGPPSQDPGGGPTLGWRPGSSGPGMLTLEGGPPGAWVRISWSETARRTLLADGNFLLLEQPIPGGILRLDGNGAGSLPVPPRAASAGTEIYIQGFVRGPGRSGTLASTNGLYLMVER